MNKIQTSYHNMHAPPSFRLSFKYDELNIILSSLNVILSENLVDDEGKKKVKNMIKEISETLKKEPIA